MSIYLILNRYNKMLPNPTPNPVLSKNIYTEFPQKRTIFISLGSPNVIIQLTIK